MKKMLQYERILVLEEIDIGKTTLYREIDIKNHLYFLMTWSILKILIQAY